MIRISLSEEECNRLN